MRRARIKDTVENAPIYHLRSQTVNGERFIGKAGKEVLRRMIWQVADFAGLEVITYAVMCNHFHILVRVPKPEPISDEELLRRYHVLYPDPTRYQTARIEVVRAQLAENGPEAVAWRKRQLSLMNDISQYMKLVKERFSIWHNDRHQRFGPVWADRFKSTLVEPRDRVVRTIAAYIDLNCVRAGMVKDPKDFRFCGYAESVAGHEPARKGIRSVVGGTSWEDTHAEYRKLLFLVGSGPRQNAAIIPLEHVRQVLREGGKLPLPEVLRCRVRYFSQGAVLGSREYVETHLARYREQTGTGKRMFAQLLPAITDWGEIAGLRRLRGELVG